MKVASCSLCWRPIEVKLLHPSFLPVSQKRHKLAGCAFSVAAKVKKLLFFFYLLWPKPQRCRAARNTWRHPVCLLAGDERRGEYKCAAVVFSDALAEECSHVEEYS